MRFVGAKGGAGVWQQIISQMPPHRVFVEAFAGTATITRLKRPAQSTIVIDSDGAAPALVNPPAGVTAINNDARVYIPQHLCDLASDTLIYADPPYLREVRSCQRDYYRNEMATPEEHTELLKLLRSLPCMVIISGYWSQLYSDLLPGWRTHQIPTVNRRGRRVVEWLWMNYPVPFALHDPRFVGRNYIDRQRIKRKAERWVRMLGDMPAAERAAVIDAVDCARCQTWDPTAARVLGSRKDAGDCERSTAP